MKLFRIYCGLDTKGQLTLEQARETALGLACDWFPHGHTIMHATGRWRQHNAPVDESTIIIEVMPDYELQARNLSGAYKALAYQEAVMVVRTEANVDFV